LANTEIHERFIAFARIGETRGVAVGRYVLMPDHAHLFIQGSPDFVLAQWVRLLKRELSKAIPCDRPHWQKGFFDHVIRNAESYAGKWDYVRENSVRAGLAVNADAWPWQGELVRLEAM
jgi:putative transposase